VAGNSSDSLTGEEMNQQEKDVIFSSIGKSSAHPWLLPVAVLCGGIVVMAFEQIALRGILQRFTIG